MKSWNEPIVQQLDEKTFVVRDDIKSTRYKINVYKRAMLSE